MEQPLISIIIPCFNVAPYIQRCLDSVASQTYRNIEVLLIDDCGTDNTIDIIKAFIDEYKGDLAFRVFKQECNKGVSCARNRGIEESKGEYIYFLDSDDSITGNCIETMVKPVMMDSSVEMVVGNYKIIGPLYFGLFMMQERTYSANEIIEGQFTYAIYGMPWNKLIRRDFIIRNNLFFVAGIIHEDVLWSYYCALCLNTLHIVLTRTYNYYVHPGSITTSDSKSLHQDQMLKGLMLLVDYIFSGNAPDKKDVRSNTTVYKHMSMQICDLLMDPVLEGQEDIAKERYHELRKHKQWNIIDIMMMNGLKVKERTRYLHWLMPEKAGYAYYKKRHLKHHHLQPETYHMKLTVITVNYNNFSGLQRTIPSVVSQTYTGYEFIVVDGGSTDGSKEYIASQERIDSWVSEPDKGVYNAMNKAVQMAHGEYCIFMNSGDTFFSAQALEQCVDRLGTYDYIGGKSVYMEADNAYPFIPPKDMNLDFLLVNALCHQSLFSKVEVLRKYPFNENHHIVSDWEQYFKAWFIHGCTFSPLDIFVSIFYLDGISGTNKVLDATERDETICHIIAESGEKGKTLEKKYERFLTGIKESCAPQTAESVAKDCRITPKRAKRQEYRERLRRKIEKVMSKRSPLMRDLGVAKYGLKFFFKDLFL